jgi:hypothetical protein
VQPDGGVPSNCPKGSGFGYLPPRIQVPVSRLPAAKTGGPSRIVASLGVTAATFPLQRRITGPEVARNE